MNLIRKLAWFFKLEKRRYIIGILALSLVSVFNLIPPRVIGQVIDRIASKHLTSQELLFNLLLLIASAFIMYGLRYVWRLYILGTSNNLGRILRSRLFEHFTHMSPSFYQKYRTGDLMAHATNDINAVVSLAGGYSPGDPVDYVFHFGLAADFDCHCAYAFLVLGNRFDWS